MRRSNTKKIKKLSPDSLKIAQLAVALSDAGSRFEDHFWQKILDERIEKILKNHKQDILDQATEHLSLEHHSNAYEVLYETIEAQASYREFEHDQQHYCASIIAAPILAWSLYEIQSESISPTLIKSLTLSWKDSLLAKNAQLFLVPHLFSIEHLPKNHSEAFDFLQRGFEHLILGKHFNLPKEWPKTVPFAADTRFLIGVVVSPKTHEALTPIFQWQDQVNNEEVTIPLDLMKAKESALTLWRQRSHADIAQLLPGCGFDMLLPDSYYASCREADLTIRPISIKTAVFFLTQALQIEASSLNVIIGRFGADDEQVSELRIGFCINHPDYANSENTIVYGVIWPLYREEDEMLALLGDMTIEKLDGEIPRTLKECGIHEFMIHDEVFDNEFCDDCGAPYFADADGELVHPEMPEQVEGDLRKHFH